MVHSDGSGAAGAVRAWDGLACSMRQGARTHPTLFAPQPWAAARASIAWSATVRTMARTPACAPADATTLWCLSPAIPSGGRAASVLLGRRSLQRRVALKIRRQSARLEPARRPSPTPSPHAAETSSDVLPHPQPDNATPESRPQARSGSRRPRRERARSERARRPRRRARRR